MPQDFKILTRDEVEAIEAARREKEKRGLSKNPFYQLFGSYSFQVDSEPYKDSNGDPLIQSQDRHIQLSNQSGKVMLDTAIAYRIPEMNNPALIDSIRKDLNVLICLTPRNIYEPNTLNARIIHFFGSQIITPVERNILVPDYSDGPTLNAALGEEQGYNYLQAFLLTNDSPNEMKRKLEDLSGKKADETIIWTPSQAGRTINPERVSGFNYYHHSFRVGGGYLDAGRSRGVLVNPR